MASKAAKARGDKTGKKEVDPEVLMQRKFRAKCLFRRIVRLAMANTYWLLEETEQYEGLDDVKKRVAQAMRRKKPQKKKLLSLADKGLLNKPAQDRTDQEKKYIYRIIGGLKCFKRYPNHVKKKLAAVTYFKYYGPGRVIVRQHHMAHAMYFLVTGEVVVTQLVYDGLLNVDVPVEIAKICAGDMFGEVSLLHNIPRTATCTTIRDCELLVLMKDDFKHILQASIQASWDIVRTAMSFFSYFDGLDEVSKREGCIMAKMKTYNVDEIILGDNTGVANFVYFVLSGCCQMIETIKVIETTRLGRTYYTLYDPHVSMNESDENLSDKYIGGNVEVDSSETLSRDVASSTSQTFKTLDSIYKIGETSTHQSTGEVASRLANQDRRKSSNVKDDLGDSIVELKRVSTPNKISVSKSMLENNIPQEMRESVRFSLLLQDTMSVLPPSTTLPLHIRTYFMQVCQFNPGSSFGFGENMRDRRIVALTPVECMLMPKIWLLQRNTANIWTRIRHFLDKKIPTKKQLFKVFKTERRWEEFREQLVGDVVARCNAVNSTSLHDVPYSIRMEEMIDI